MNTKRSRQDTPQRLELEALIKNMNLAGLTIVRYGSRVRRITGRCTGGPLEYCDGDRLDLFQHRLARATGSRVDNHEIYEVVTAKGQKLCLLFTDRMLLVGNDTTAY